MEKKEYNKMLRQVFKHEGFKDLKPSLKTEFIGFKRYTIVEFEGLQIMFGGSWAEKYRDHYTHWGYDKDVEFANLVVRAYCVLNGTPKEDVKDLPFGIGVRKMMVEENLLIGIEFRRKTQDLFGDNWEKIDKIVGPAPQLIYAHSCY